MRRWCTQVYEKGLPQVVMFIRIGIGIAFGVEVTIDPPFDSDPDSDPGDLAIPALFSIQKDKYEAIKTFGNPP